MKKRFLVAVFLSLGLVIGSIFPISFGAGTVEAASIKYDDYQSNQYWSSDMLWAINKGLMQGYMNTEHPRNKKGKVGNWLDPQGDLTEAQMFTIVWRYVRPTEMKPAKSLEMHWKDISEVLGQDYGFYGFGKDHHATRGDLARILASLHYNGWVHPKDAIQFMYDAKLSTGLVINGKSPMTFDSFGANEPLKRAHIVSFMKRYDEFLKAGGKTVVKEEMNGLKVQYGHAYNSETQYEYDAIMKKVGEEIKSAEKEFNGGLYHNKTPDEISYYEAYFNGKMPILDKRHPEFRTEHNIPLWMVHLHIGKYVAAGLTIEQINEVDMLNSVISSVEVLDYDYWSYGEQRSPYTVLFDKEVLHPVQRELLKSAVYDAKGYTTVVLSIPGKFSAVALVKAVGKWYSIDGFEEKDIEEYLKNGYKVVEHPNDGTVLTYIGR